MAPANPTQAEADALLAIGKVRVDDTVWQYPDPGQAVRIPLVSADRREMFNLDISRGRIDLSKRTYQNRARKVIVLVRLDTGSQPHRNPDGEEVPSPHLHLYREGYEDAWAVPVPIGKFPNIADPWLLLVRDFTAFCNIIRPPRIHRGLFT